MFFTTLKVGPLEVNCYIIAKEKEAVIVDPGGSPLDIENTLKTNGLELEAIINTHGHYDHIGANQFLAEKYNCPVYIHEKEIGLLKDKISNLSAWFEGDLEQDYEMRTVKDQKILHLGGLEFKVIHTPGHTPGSVCLLQENNLFTGDTLFKESIGRTDLPGSSPQKMEQSLKILAALDKSLKVYPGHGETTNLDEELKQNPFLKTGF